MDINRLLDLYAKHRLKISYDSPDSGDHETEAIKHLLNQGYDAQKLLRASYSFSRIGLETVLALETPIVVQHGLFEGMILYPKSLASSLLPKWQGTYEAEVQNILLEHTDRVNSFVDIGCAEGFYLAGVARWLGIPCYGVDVDPLSREAVEYVANVNNLSELVHFCDSIDEAVMALQGSALVLIDVDGNEEQVLNECMASLLQNTSLSEVRLLIESDKGHGQVQNISSLISWLVHNDWNIQTICPQDPSLRFVRSSSSLSFLTQVLFGTEGRPASQSWILARRSF